MKSQENQKAIQTQNEKQELLYQELSRSIEGPIPDPILQNAIQDQRIFEGWKHYD